MNIKKLPTHPAADIFPMLSPDELQELAEDIKENGLNHPLVIGEHEGKTVLIDGRNRRAACELAGVEATTVVHEGDAVTFIISENIKRRHMTKGQQAMAVAMMYPEPKRGMHSELKNSTGKDFDKGNISRARTVINYASELADNVLSGSRSLDEAYKIAQERKRESSSTEKQLAELREAAPDLADAVVEERLTMAGAKAEVSERENIRKVNIDALNSALDTVIAASMYFSAKTPEEIAKGLDTKLEPRIHNRDASLSGLRAVVKLLEKTK